MRRSAGFTLLELMVVMVIIGLVAAGAVLSLSGTGRDSQLEQERDRLAALIDYVRERAALQTVEYGLRCHQGGYRFVMYDSRQDQWTEDPLDESLRERTLPAGLSIELSVENRPIVLPKAAPGGVAAKSTPGRSGATADRGGLLDLTPQVMLYSSGDVSTFRLTLARPEAHRTTVISNGKAGKIDAGAVSEAPT